VHPVCTAARSAVLPAEWRFPTSWKATVSTSALPRHHAPHPPTPSRATWRRVRRVLTAGVFVATTVAGVSIGLNGAAVAPVAPTVTAAPATGSTPAGGAPSAAGGTPADTGTRAADGTPGGGGTPANGAGTFAGGGRGPHR
jgi:hypothetical protein